MICRFQERSAVGDITVFDCIGQLALILLTRVRKSDLTQNGAVPFVWREKAKRAFQLAGGAAFLLCAFPDTEERLFDLKARL